MKLTVPRREFAAALTTVTKIVSARNTIPILFNVALETAGDRLVIRASDLDIEIATSIGAVIEREGSLTTPAARLREIVSTMAGDVIDIASTDGKTIEIRRGRAKLSLPILPIEDFPKLTAETFPATFDLRAPTLTALVAATEMAICTDETRFYLNGVFLRTETLDDGAHFLTAVSTDGHRLARAREPIDDAVELEGVIVPTKTVQEIGRLAKLAEGQVRLEISSTKLRLTAGDTVMVSRLIDGTFPDYGRVIPARNESAATFDRAELAAAVGLVGTVATKRDSAIRLEIGTAAIRLSVRDETGAASEEVGAVLEGGEETIGLNGLYLTQALGSLAGQRTRISYSSAGSPAVLTNTDDPTGLRRLIVVMPMRV